MHNKCMGLYGNLSEIHHLWVFYDLLRAWNRRLFLLYRFPYVLRYVLHPWRVWKLLILERHLCRWRSSQTHVLPLRVRLRKSQNGSQLDKCVTNVKKNWVTLGKMGHTVKMSHTVKSGSHLKKWITFEKWVTL